MKLEIIKHNDILFRDLLRAIAVKSIAWPHPLESQVRWIVDNMHEDDEHVFLRDVDKDIAYMTLSPVVGVMNGLPVSFMGVGCVCSANPGTGGGKLLIINVNKYLTDNNQRGLLFCKENLVGFYSKYNWKVIPPERVCFKDPHEGVFTMAYNVDDIQKLDYTDRFF